MARAIHLTSPSRPKGAYVNEEVYRVWEPVPDLPRVMDFHALHHDEEMFRVLLRGLQPADPVLRLLFEHVVAYRCADEGVRLRTISRLQGQLPCPLMLVENSTFVTWLRDESAGVLADQPLVHYAILSINDCIDVISGMPPRVDWL